MRHTIEKGSIETTSRGKVRITAAHAYELYVLARMENPNGSFGIYDKITKKGDTIVYQYEVYEEVNG